MVDASKPSAAASAEASAEETSSRPAVKSQDQAPTGADSSTCGGDINVSSHLPSQQVLDQAAQIPVLDSAGEEHPFGKICSWPEEEGVKKRVMVIFVRHFFCCNCQEYLKLLVSSVGSPSSLPPGTKLVVIGCGGPTLIPMYAETTACTFPIYTDPSKRLYSLLGMTRNLSLGPAPSYVKQSMLSQTVRGISQGLQRIWAGDALKSGDISQIGGEFLFETTGNDPGPDTTEVTWCHRMKNTRDHAEIYELRRHLGLEVN